LQDQAEAFSAKRQSQNHQHGSFLSWGWGEDYAVSGSTGMMKHPNKSISRLFFFRA